MKVSVIIPTYNRGYIIRDAIDSVLQQTYNDCEILVIDDGSTDNTQELVRACCSRNLKYLRHESNRGCSAAYNTGISAATGQLIAFLDSDDAWKPDYLARQARLFVHHPEVDVVFTDTEIRQNGAVVPSLMVFMRVFPKLLGQRNGSEYVLTSREMYLCLLEEVPIKPSACVLRREILSRANGFDEAWPSGTDWDLFLRLSHFAIFGYIDSPLVVQRRTADATHQKFVEQDKLFLLSVFARERDHLDRDSQGLRAVRRGLAGLFNSLGWAYMEREEWGKAVKVYFEGFRQTFNLVLLRKMFAAPVHAARKLLVRKSKHETAPSADGAY